MIIIISFNQSFWLKLEDHTDQIHSNSLLFGADLVMLMSIQLKIRTVSELTAWYCSSVSMSPTELSSQCSTNLSLKLQRFTERKFHYFQINQRNKDKTFHAYPKSGGPPTSRTSKPRLQKDIFIFMVSRGIIWCHYVDLAELTVYMWMKCSQF